MPNTEHNITSSGAAAPTALGRSKTDPSQSNYTEGAELRRSQSEVSSKSFMDIAYSTLEQLLILHKRLTPEMALRVAEVVVAEQDLLSENRKRKASAEKRFTVKLSEAVSTAIQAIAAALGPRNMTIASDQLQKHNDFRDMLKKKTVKIARNEVSKKKKVKGGGRTRKNLKKKRKRKSRHTRKNKRRKTKRKRVLKRKSRRN